MRQTLKGFVQVRDVLDASGNVVGPGLLQRRAVSTSPATNVPGVERLDAVSDQCIPPRNSSCIAWVVQWQALGISSLLHTKPMIFACQDTGEHQWILDKTRYNAMLITWHLSVVSFSRAVAPCVPGQQSQGCQGYGTSFVFLRLLRACSFLPRFRCTDGHETNRSYKTYTILHFNTRVYTISDLKVRVLSPHQSLWTSVIKCFECTWSAI